MNEKSRISISGVSRNLGSEIVQRLETTPEIEVVVLKPESENSYVGNLLIRDEEPFAGRKILFTVAGTSQIGKLWHK